MIDESNIVKQIKDFKKSFELRSETTEYMKGFLASLDAVKEMIENEVKIDLPRQAIKELELEIKNSTLPLPSQELLIKLVREKEIVFSNGDVIRSMSDKKLAEFLVNFKNTFGEEYEGEMSCFDWLREEAE